MRFRKIKYDKGRVNIEYEVNNKGGWDEFSLNCVDEPRPDFGIALQALGDDIIDICELPDDYRSRIRMTSVSFSYGGDNEVMAATLISQMNLHRSNVALNLNTPHKSSEPYSEGGDATQCLSLDCIEHLTSLMLEAEDYVNGKRAQGELFAEAPKEETLEKKSDVVFS